MKSVNTWNLTNNKLHQLFKNDNEYISIKVRGNTWEPITRWLRLDSRIFRETTTKARITLCDIESLAEIYNYRSIRWKAKKLTPLPTKLIFIFIISKFIPSLIFALTFIYYFFFKNIINFNFKENIFLILGFLFFGLSWSFIKHKNSFKEILFILIIGPYFLTSFLLQSGLFTDRSRDLRENMEYVSSLDIVKNQSIKVDKSGIIDSESQSKIIRISLLVPKLGNGLESIEQLKKSELVWTTDFQEINNNNSYEVIYENDILKPWKLILKK